MIDIVAREKTPRNPKATEMHFEAGQAATPAISRQLLVGQHIKMGLERIGPV